MYKIKRFSIDSDLEGLANQSLPDQYYKLVDLENKYNIKYVLSSSIKNDYLDIPVTVSTRQNTNFVRNIAGSVGGFKVGKSIVLAYDDTSYILWDPSSNVYSFRYDGEELKCRSLKEAVVSLLNCYIYRATTAHKDYSNDLFSVFSNHNKHIEKCAKEALSIITEYRNYLIKNLR